MHGYINRQQELCLSTEESSSSVVFSLQDEHRDVVDGMGSVTWESILALDINRSRVDPSKPMPLFFSLDCHHSLSVCVMMASESISMAECLGMNNHLSICIKECPFTFCLVGKACSARHILAVALWLFHVTNQDCSRRHWLQIHVVKVRRSSVRWIWSVHVHSLPDQCVWWQVTFLTRPK